jgi:GT2 family glycosyltransferase
VSKQPLVSIVIPTYKPRHFEAALLSALAQSYQRLEILVSDDCPDEGIQQILDRHLGHNRHPIRVVRNRPGLGGLMNYTQCVVEAEGEFVKFLNDDDILLNDCVARMVEVFLKHPEVSLVTSRRLLIDELGLPLADIPATCNPFAEDSLIDGEDLISYLCDEPMNFIGEPSTVMFCRAHLADVTPNVCCLGGQTVRAINDLAMYVNVLRHGGLAYLCEPLSCFRKHAEQRQQQGDILPLWRKGVAVFTSQIRSMGLYRPQPQGQVRCRTLGAQDADWHLFSLRQRLAEEAALLAQTQPVPPSAAGAMSATGRDAGGVAIVAPDKPELVRWLEARLPTPVQSRLISDYFRQQGGGPGMGILILDLSGDTQLLMKTIRSLSLEQSLYASLKIVALTTADTPQTSPDAKLHFISVRPDNYIAKVNEVARTADFGWMMLVDAGVEFTVSGLMMVALELANSEGCRAVYGDELQRMADGTLGAAFRPGFNLDMLLSFPAAMARHWLFRREVLVEAGGFDPRFAGALEFELLLRLIEQGGMAGLGHVDEPLLITTAPQLIDSPHEQAALLAHLQRRGYTEARLLPGLPGRYRIHYGHREQPLVSIIVPTKDQLPILQRCVESLLEKTAYGNYELLIVDNNSETPEALAWFEGVEAMGDSKVRILRYPHPFNYSAINNMAAREARGEYLVLLNNDTAIISERWLDELLNHALRPEVGIVGAKLLYPDGRIQHAGVVLGLRGPADHPFIGEPMDAPGYMQRLQVDQNYSAVTAACLMIRKSIYEDVGGLEEGFQVSYNDVDLCLKVREAGHLIVWTPHAVVMHEGSVSQKRIDPKAVETKRQRFIGEQDAMYEKWLPALARDPAYNRNLSLNGRGFELETDVNLTWRPLTWRPLPVVLAHPADPWGCGNYRVIRPLQAMRRDGLVDGMLSEGLLQVVDLERYNPDIIVLQRQIGDERLEAMRRIQRLSQAFTVYELDDYLPNLPMKSMHREHMPKDILKSMRRGLSFVDRFVVSTEPLAEALAGLHGDIRVIENRLPVEWWKDLSSQRRRGRKPRVGWAGGVSHTGDLELIADVVKELAAEVEWVFFGMCPEAIRPYVHEVHEGVQIDLYPAALARLDLDLALAPIEQNLFNECKSNLRLLEYGACGFPVVCSDLRPYQGNLPVTRVKNRFKDWVDAIRMHINDLDASARMGDELRANVLSDWMLEGNNLVAWREAWSPS